MRYVLDTHYVLWSQFEPERINEHIKAILSNEEVEKLVSAISLWEISLKYSIGKLELIDTTPDEILDVVVESGLMVVPVAPDLYASYYQLPKKERHKDPFDRMLVWQAIQGDLTMITNDPRMEAYVVDGLKIMLGR